MLNCLHKAAYDVLMLVDPVGKCMAMHALFEQWNDQKKRFTWLGSETSIQKIPDPGRPLKPELVSPKVLAKRSLHTQEGRCVLMHAIAHIEFNAINLALDAVYRFRDQPESFYGDWLKVADDEARHFMMVLSYLEDNQLQYGEHVAHNGLWEMVVKTDHDILHRMALVPRVLEARGLDVSPAMIKKLEQAGDSDAAEILTVIYNDEISHVETGSRWFKYYCKSRQLEPQETFFQLIDQYLYGSIRGPFNEAARLKAGFMEEELAQMNERF